MNWHNESKIIRKNNKSNNKKNTAYLSTYASIKKYIEINITLKQTKESN